MSETDKNNYPVSWKQVETSMHTLISVDGGYSAAHRGILTLPDGQQIFVKVGVDKDTKQWAKKDVETYRFLQRHDYAFAPGVLAINEDESSFALEALTEENGWDWSDMWTQLRLDKTLQAMDALAGMTPADPQKENIDTKTIFEFDDGWRSLVKSEALQNVLLKKLHDAGHDGLACTLDFAALAAQNANFAFTNDLLVHNDVRGDNCAWNPQLQTVKLVDWNWAGLGDRRIDMNALLVSVQKSGFDVQDFCPDRLDADALCWLAGFWLNATATPIWPGGPERLRDFQLESGIVALGLMDYPLHT